MAILIYVRYTSIL